MVWFMSVNQLHIYKFLCCILQELLVMACVATVNS
ncbi:hypothetical protein OIU79_030473 [Salix purpurea]|uniref:Uncharacterized protein n=1 Tax=Salix purpurea TaxID=77065 RepID=A0A9Q0ZRL5_SALPP|nr:hypothetical protein OIU79_030473 [Salix purpurea]